MPFILLIAISCSSQKGTEQRDGVRTDVSEYKKPPNILFAISDDQSYPHISAYGSKFIHTPAFDRVAKEGILFTNAFAASSSCSPSRAALLTGRNCWQLEQAGTHGSSFPDKYVVYPDFLEENGYFVGYTGKGWGQGNYKSEWSRTKSGRSFI